MTDYDALYAAMLDRPEDDTPRLVLADWLDDHDEPARAEFIRVQCRGGDLGAMLGAKPSPVWMISGNPLHRLRSWCHRTGDVVCVAEGGVELVYRRGFVSEVRLSLAAFVGGECGRCGGDGQAHGSDRPFEGPPGPCPAKCDRGRVPGLALKAELFAAHPITRVVLTGREPFSYLDAPKWGWSVSAGSRDRGETSYLPEDIWGKTIDARTPGREGPNVWATRDDAMTALSDACVAYGRALAGLRSLTVGGRPA